MFGHVYTDIFGPVVVWKDSPRDLFSPTQLREKVSFSFGHQWTFLAPLAQERLESNIGEGTYGKVFWGNVMGRSDPAWTFGWEVGHQFLEIFGDWCDVWEWCKTCDFLMHYMCHFLGIYVNIHFVLFDDASIVEADFFWQLNSHEQATCPSFLGGS